MFIKKILKYIIPDRIKSYLRLFGGAQPNHSYLGWFGNYQSWAEARNSCAGYDPKLFLDKLIASSKLVESGAYAYERDTVVMDHILYSWPLLSSLLAVYARESRLRVIDFGGSLGSTWRQNKKYLEFLPNVEWNIVEQGPIVKKGKELFEKPPLQFYERMDSSALSSCNAVLFAGVLCYLEQPELVLQQMECLNEVKYCIFDRTPFSEDDEDRITIQTVPAYIYAATYPCWLFSRMKLLTRMQQKWKLIETWVWDEQPWPEAVFRGYFFERK